VRNYWLRDKFYRDRCATAFDPNFYIMTQNCFQFSFYRDRSSVLLNLYPDGKKHAIPSLHREYFAARQLAGFATPHGAVVG
jgi:hypothetical protein